MTCLLCFCVSKRSLLLQPVIMFYQKIAEISYNSAALSFFGTGQDDLPAAFLVSNRKQLYRKMTGELPKLVVRGPQEQAGQKPMPIPAAIRFRTDSVVSLSKMIWGVKASFHKIAVCDLADGLGTAQTDVICIFRVC